MKVTRRGVFETNSSSTHSITIVEGDFVADRMPMDDGVCAVYPGEFGWDIEDYTDAASKASYALTYAANAPEAVREGLLATLRDVLKVETGAREVEFRPTPTDRSFGYEWGYIDHQSYIGDSDVGAAAFASPEALRAFIFNPASVLHTDNDNHE